MKAHDISIGKRLGAAFGVLLSLLVAVTLLGIGGMTDIHGWLASITGENNAALSAAHTMRIAAFERTLSVRNLQVATMGDEPGGEGKTSPAERRQRVEKESARVADARVRFGAARAALAAIHASQAGGLTEEHERERALLAKLAELDGAAAPLESRLLKAVMAGQDHATAFPLIKEARNVLRSAVLSTGELQALIESRNAAAVAEAEIAYERARGWIAALSALALGLGAVLAWMAARSITVPIGRAVAVARAVARGELGLRIEAGGRDETGQLMLALRDMTASLADIVGQVRGATGAIAAASAGIAQGNMELSARTEQQAGSLEETAASMEELTSTVRQNAHHAHAAGLLVAGASEAARKGGEAVGQVVHTMAAIHASARKIADIIGVIDGIAFQTNILALNAAVEAARAGEQGRGFAVVASEVRELAQSSAAAAREIKSLIGASVGEVDAGNKLAAQAGATMEELAASVRRVSDIMARITSSSHEQRAGIEEVNQAIVLIDGATQQNAALVETAAGAAQGMRAQAAALTQAVSLFKLEASPALP